MESKEGGIAIGGAAATELDTAVRAMTCRPLRRTHTVTVETGEGGGQELGSLLITTITGRPIDIIWAELTHSAKK